MDKKYLKICKILKEFGNCAAGITGTYESPARPWKVTKVTIVKKIKAPTVNGPVSKRNKKKGY